MANVSLFGWINRSPGFPHGPDSHRSTNLDGVVVRAISVDGDNSERAKQIDRGESLNLINPGDGSPSYASFHLYQFRPSAGGNSDVSALPDVGYLATSVSTRGTKALSYGGEISASHPF